MILLAQRREYQRKFGDGDEGSDRQGDMPNRPLAQPLFDPFYEKASACVSLWVSFRSYGWGSNKDDSRVFVIVLAIKRCAAGFGCPSTIELR